jgi:hypothetical protein
LSPPSQATPHTPAPECPRCGYDLSGAAGAWKDSCPLTGICSECGLDFQWRDIFTQRLLGPRWSFEHGPRISHQRWLGTSSRALTPWRLWSGLQLFHDIRAARLFIFAASWLVLMHLGSIGAAVFSPPAWGPPRALLSPETLDLVVWPYGGSIGYGSVSVDMVLEPLAIWTFTQVLLLPVAMLVLGDSLRKCRVRRAHLLRGACLSVAWGVAGFAFLVCVTLGVSAFVRYSPFVSSTLRDTLATILLIALFPLLQLLWWRSFITRYLRLPHAFAVAFLMALIAALAAATLVVFYGLYIGR